MKANDIINIKGVKYRKKQIGNNSSKSVSRVCSSDQLDKSKCLDIDVVEEYKLILDKKSKLSRDNRDFIVKVFNSQYEKIK